jgi:hypothetical protein
MLSPASHLNSFQNGRRGSGVAGVAGRRRLRLAAAPALRSGGGAVVPAGLLTPPTSLLLHLINMWGGCSGPSCLACKVGLLGLRDEGLQHPGALTGVSTAAMSQLEAMKGLGVESLVVVLEYPDGQSAAPLGPSRARVPHRAISEKPCRHLGPHPRCLPVTAPAVFRADLPQPRTPASPGALAKHDRCRHLLQFTPAAPGGGGAPPARHCSAEGLD